MTKKEKKSKPVLAQGLKDRDVQLVSQALKGKTVALGVCGGIACVESVKLIRELRRHGGEVTVFYTPEVLKFMTELPAQWASGRPVITEPRAEVDHLERFDLVLIVPATLNTISKAALGLTDNGVTLLIASQIGKRGPLLFVPAMNLSLKEHPVLSLYTQTLRSWGAHFLFSDTQEDRIKVPAPEPIVKKAIEIVEASQ